MTEIASKVQSFLDYANQCNGSESFYRHLLARRMTYSDGVKFMADTLGAHWLVDAIASYVATTKRVQLEELQVWTLHAKEGDAVRLAMILRHDGVLIVAVGRSNTATSRASSCPSSSTSKKGGDDWTLILPEER